MGNPTHEQSKKILAALMSAGFFDQANVPTDLFFDDHDGKVHAHLGPASGGGYGTARESLRASIEVWRRRPLSILETFALDGILWNVRYLTENSG